MAEKFVQGPITLRRNSPPVAPPQIRASPSNHRASTRQPAVKAIGVVKTVSHVGLINDLCVSDVLLITAGAEAP